MGLKNVRARAMLYPAYTDCGSCDGKHLYMALTFPQITLLKELLGKHKEKIARRTLKCIEESLEAPKDGSDYHGRFICAHCDNEYIAVDMSDLELKYLKQILDHIWCPCNGPGGDGNSPNDPIDDGSRINDSTKHRLVDVLNMPPFHDVDQIFRDYSIGQIDEVLYRHPDVHIHVWED